MVLHPVCAAVHDEELTLEVACLSLACSTSSLYEEPLLLWIFSFSICSTKAFCFAFNRFNCYNKKGMINISTAKNIRFKQPFSCCSFIEMGKHAKHRWEKHFPGVSNIDFVPHLYVHFHILPCALLFNEHICESWFEGALVLERDTFTCLWWTSCLRILRE